MAVSAKGATRKRGKLTSFFVKLLLVFGTLLVLFCVLEIVFRVVWPQNISFLEYDPELGWLHKKNASGYYRQENQEPALVTTDSNGLRTPEYAPGKDSGTTRIVVLGDSYVEGLSTDDDSTFCRQLERALNDKGKGRAVQVINAGVGGYSPIQEMLLLERIMPIYRPDMVIQVIFAGNDFYDNADPAGGRRPIGRIEPDGALAVIPPKPNSMVATVVRDKVLGKSHFAFFLRSRVIPASYRLARLAEGLGLATYAGMGVHDLDFDREWAVFEMSVLRTQKLCLDAGAAYALVYLPTPSAATSLGADDAGDGGEQPKTPTRLRLRAKEDAANRVKAMLNKYPGSVEDEQIKRMSAVAQNNSIPFLDLKSAYSDASKDGQEIYFENLGHLTQYGHQATAAALKPFVEQLLAQQSSSQNDL